MIDQEKLQYLKKNWHKFSENQRREIRVELELLDRRLDDWKPLPGPQTLAFNSPAQQLFYGGSGGSGKGLSLKELLPTPHGFKAMADIQPGDQVFDEQGKACTVIGISEINQRRVFKITFDDGSTIKADDVHQWFTQDYKQRLTELKRSPAFRERRKLGRASRAKTVSQKPWVSASITQINKDRAYDYLPVDEGSVRNTLDLLNTLTAREGTHLNHSIKLAKPIDLPHAELDIDPYTLGVWLGNGMSASGSIGMGDNDLKEIISYCPYKVTSYKTEGLPKYNNPFSIVRLEGLQTQLKAAGLIKNKHISIKYLRASIEQRKELLRGILDTDGHANGAGSIELGLSDRRLIDDCYELISSLGIRSQISTKKTKCKDSYRVSFSCNFPAFKLKRKLERQKLVNFRGTVTRRYIKNIVEVESEPTKCIAVDSPSRLYLVGRSFIPTHNTDLMLGIAHTRHHNSIIFRREYKQFRGIVKRGKELIDNRGLGRFNKVDYVWNLANGGTIELGACKDLGDEEKFQGIPHDLKGFDEITHFLESQFRYLCGWLRSTRSVPKRIVCAGNPPTTPEGEWVTQYWGAWLNKDHVNPALPGELRWYTTIDGKETEFATGDPIDYKGEILVPESRTFIPGSVDDNPFLIEQGYKSRLQGLPEPLRSKMLYGDFSAGREDDAWQLIPTEWVYQAQARWKARPKPAMPMTTLGVDIARGGADSTILSPRYGNYFGEQLKYPGSATPDGPTVVGYIFKVIEQGTQVNFDIIGVGGSVYDILTSYKIPNDPINGASSSSSTDSSGFFGFINRRAELYWRFREALDPESGQDICLPPCRELLAELCAPRYKVTTRGYQVEDKEAIKKRIGKSPDLADSIIYAFETPVPGILFGRVQT